MEFLSPVIKMLLDYTVTPITRQVGYVIFYPSNVEELKEAAEALQRTRERVQHEVDAAVRNGELIEGDVKKWLEEVDEITLKFNELNNDERHANTGCSTRSFPNLCFRHKLSRQSKKMKVVIVETNARGNFDRVSYREVPKFTRLISSRVSMKELGEPKIDSQLESRLSKQNDIMKALEDPMVQTIGVHGLPGVGKSTLVEAVAKKAQRHGLFDVVVLLKITQNPDLEKIQLQIADMLGLNFKEQSLNGRACRLHDRLNLKHERILIIMDDIWQELNMDEIGIPPVHKDLKILMTSRSGEVLSNQMNTHVNFLLQVLPRMEAWKLFMDKAQFDESAVSGEFLSIATQVVKECADLPVAIVIVASALRNKSLLEWKDALRQLQNPALTNIIGAQDQIYKFIEVSYDMLENELLKSIFLLCGVMQSNSLIMDLFKVSIGLGFFKDIYTLEEARNSLYTCIRKLKDSCLLLDSSPKCFNMHDIVQDVAIFLASRQHHLFFKRYGRLEEWPEGDQLTSYKTIILDRCDIDGLPEGLYCPNLTFFHLNSQEHFSNIEDNCFEGIHELKVLTLAGETLCSLPSSINLLCNLRALCLNSYRLGKLGIIGELRGLKILTLSSYMTQLPQELCQLNQLQLLDLRGCYNLVLIPPNLLSSLTKLQELYLATHIYSEPIQWCVDDPNYKQQSMKHRGKEVFDGASDPNNQQSKASLGELNNLARLTTLETCICDEKMLPKDLVFERLRSYKIIIGSEPNLSSEYETSRILKLDLNNSIHSWHNVKNLLDSVEDLHLYHLKGAKNVVPGTNEGMPQLKHLHLQYSDEIQTIVDLSRRNLLVDIFPNMESLFIDCCTNLEEICNGSLTGGSFSRLKAIKVANCGKIKSLFSFSSFRGHPHCNIMEETNENPESMLQFTELRGLMLIGLPELISFRLEDKKESSAQGKQLPSTDMDGEIVREDNIPHTPHTSIALFNDKVMLPNLEEMIIIYVVKLNTIWHWQQQLCPKSFDKLRKLEIENCPKLVIIFPSHIGSSINNLETLLITNCESLEHVFEETE